MKKTCSSCRAELPLTSFHRDSRAKDGRRSRCATCVAAASQRAAMEPPVIQPGVTSKTCTRCDKELPLEAFGTASRMKDGKNSWCKKCCSEATRAWQQTESGRAKHAEAVKRYRARKRWS